MARMRAAFRGSRFTRAEIEASRPLIKHLTKPMLIAALEDVQAVCPPRVTRQTKATLVAAVERALNQADDQAPVRLAMQAALARVRAML